MLAIGNCSYFWIVAIIHSAICLLAIAIVLIRPPCVDYIQYSYYCVIWEARALLLLFSFRNCLILFSTTLFMTKAHLFVCTASKSPSPSVIMSRYVLISPVHFILILPVSELISLITDFLWHLTNTICIIELMSYMFWCLWKFEVFELHIIRLFCIFWILTVACSCTVAL
jgi:hypothetical protein